MLAHVQEIGSAAFAGCAFAQVELPNRMKSIGAQAFKSCRHLTHITLPKEINAMGNEVFLNCPNLKLEPADHPLSNAEHD